MQNLIVLFAVALLDALAQRSAPAVRVARYDFLSGLLDKSIQLFASQHQLAKDNRYGAGVVQGSVVFLDSLSEPNKLVFMCTAKGCVVHVVLKAEDGLSVNAYGKLATPELDAVALVFREVLAYTFVVTQA